MAGGPRYSHKTRAGNWNEDWEASETKLKSYLKRKVTGALLLDGTQDKLKTSNHGAALTYREDGNLVSGDCIMLQSCFTSAVLVANPNEKMISSDAFSVTASSKVQGPSARSVFRIEHANACADSCIRYGQDVRLCTGADLHERELYLNSLPLTPMTFARYSRNQEVSMYYKKAYNTVWRIQPTKGLRQEQKGNQVNVSDEVILEHVATSNFLSNDHIKYQNEFGTELEVSCLAAATKHKTQILLNESQGTQVRENVHKNTAAQNLWKFCMSSDPAQAAPVSSTGKVQAAELLNLIREQIFQAPTLNFSCMIHGLIKKNDQIGVDELVWAIQQLEITMNESDYHRLFSHYQKNWNQPKIDWREFAENLRCDLTEARQEAIRAAFAKLDPQSINKVTLDDIARTYNVSGARDVIKGQRTEEQHYQTFMGLWGAMDADQ